MTVSEKIGIMEEIWSDLSSPGEGYSPPDWHDRILKERSRLAESGEVSFTDWEAAKKQIKDRISMLNGWGQRDRRPRQNQRVPGQWRR